MDNSIWLSMIFGPFLAIVGLWRLLRADALSKVIASAKATPGVFYLMCFITLLIGLVVVNLYNVWSFSIAVFITLYGWLMLVRGLVGFFFPKALMDCMSHKTCLKVWGVIPLVVGLLLCWYGFGHH